MDKGMNRGRGGPRGPHRRGRGPWDAAPWGMAWGGGGRRMRRGDIRRAILSALADGPAHGYEIMRRLEDRSGGLWRPSPGSVYPTLQMLEDEGLVKSVPRDGARVFELTEEGRSTGSAASEDGLWMRQDENGARISELRQAIGQANAAAKQVAHAGTAEQIDRSIAVVQRARQDLYKILAED